MIMHTTQCIKEMLISYQTCRLLVLKLVVIHPQITVDIVMSFRPAGQDSTTYLRAQVVHRGSNLQNSKATSEETLHQ